ncbi:choice-of-anchor Q domain-containing protein [Spirosoma fluviale]|uniref:Por secretion system C-terminal sorting domain-containing protein n=1 Tax=Spirosoma fluviale TaxID=1597977 RepID=A0A286FAL6_9BACT|nr:choice-of-anchor Q domain-containing protein [Spirosoma fluviale]SOD80271.1 Por secretion system C-terminal sorting domain-containing protein [Spirosoma fluviale]
MKNTFTEYYVKISAALPGFLLGAALWLMSALSLRAQTIYVTPGGAGQQTGADWANALPGSQLQPQLAVASQGAEFRLAGGTYKPTNTGDRTLSFSIPSGVKVLGGFAGSGSNPDQRVDFANPDQPSSTTLSGDIDNDNLLDAENSNIVVQFRSVNEQTRLDGVVITGGYATVSIFFTGSVGGGAIYNNGYQGTSNPTLQNCVFIQNYTSGRGGAVFNDGGLRGFANPVFTNCRFANNQANQGGAIYNTAYAGTANPTFINCSFLANTAARGGAIYNYAEANGPFGPGGAGENRPLLVNSVFQANTASANGGVMFNETRGAGNPITEPTLVNCSLVGNSSPQGGAFYNIATPNTINNTQIFARPSLYNSILWNNGGTNTTVNIIFKNNAGGTSTGEGYISLYNCLVEPGANNSRNTDPQTKVINSSPFVSGSSVQLSPCSPAINTGNNSYYTDRSGPSTDLAGNPRIVGGTIDIGAYEFQGAPATPLAITQQPASQSTVVAGTTVETTVGLNGPADNYAWYKDGELVPGQTSATLRLTNVQTTQSGSYSLVATSACSSVTSTAFSLTVTPPLPASQRVAHLWLINADNNQPIQEIIVGQQIDLSQLPTRRINIQARTEPTEVGSVVFQLSGQQTRQQVENIAPYALFGDDNKGSYLPWTPALGSYTLTATPYSEAGGTGTASTPLTVSFTVVEPVNPQRLAHLYLINADTDQPIQELTNGQQLDLSLLPTKNLAIQAVTDPTVVGSVVFALSGQQSHQQVETIAPYALFGDNQGDYSGWTPPLGNYTLTATPFSGAGGTGSIGTALSVSFTVIESTMPAPQRLAHLYLINADTDQPIQELTDGQQLDLSKLPTKNLAIQAVTEPAVVGSVVFALSGRESRQQVETIAPYALFGDNQGDFLSWTPSLGSYTLKATPYSSVGGTGVAGTPLSISFTVINPAAARLGAERADLPTEKSWQVRVLGNPVTNNEVVVEVSGAQGQPLVYSLTDASGRSLHTQQVDQAGAVEQQRLSIGSSETGVLLLRVSTPTQSQVIKVLKAN